MYADLSQLATPQFCSQLYQIAQLLQLSVQYFAQAQDSYAEQVETLTQQMQALNQQYIQQQNLNVQLEGQLQQKEAEKKPTPGFVLQMQQVKEANELILRENIRLKMQLKNLLPAAK